MGEDFYKAGEYFVGDPCYIIPQDEWNDFCEALWKVEDELDCHSIGCDVPWKGTKVFASSTAHGDGLFQDDYGHEYGVDAGLIGAVPMSLYPNADRKHLSDLGQIVNWSKDFSCYSDLDEEGLISIGHIQIKTDPKNNGEDDWWG